MYDPLSLVQTSSEVDQRETVTNQQSTERSSEQGETYLIVNVGSCEGDFIESRRSTAAKPIFRVFFLNKLSWKKAFLARLPTSKLVQSALRNGET